MSLFNRSEFEQAQSVVYQHIQATPQYAWPLLCEAVGCEIWLKHENHTPTGAFKVRGGLVYLDAVAGQDDEIDLITATRGNHGQSIPYAARQYNKTVHVYVPEGNSAEKNAAMEAWGAKLYVHGRDFDIAREAAEAHAEKEGLRLVPSFHPLLVRGVATYGYELMCAVGDLAAVYVPIGMGSGAAGLIGVRDMLGLRTEIIGVVSAEADALACSIQAGAIVETMSALTFADGMATRIPDPDAFEVLKKGLARVVTVSDEEVARAVRLIYTTTHNVAEGAGAAAMAAVIQEVKSNKVVKGEKIAAILTGGNIDKDWFAQILRGQTPKV